MRTIACKECAPAGAWPRVTRYAPVAKVRMAGPKMEARRRGICQCAGALCLPNCKSLHPLS